MKKPNYVEAGKEIAGVENKQDDDDDWINSIMAERPVADIGKIAQVPRALREKEENKGMFDPRVVSIGPIHHGKPELKEAEVLKITATRIFIADRKLQPRQVYNKILQRVPAARNCYLHQYASYEDKEFARMMLLDGCFILLYMYLFNKFITSDDVENISQSGKEFFEQVSNHLGGLGTNAIATDLVLLENQLPFLVLEELILAGRDAIEQVKLEQSIENFIVKVYISAIINRSERTYKNEGIHPLHILELARRRFLVCSDQVKISIRSRENSPPQDHDHKTILGWYKGRHARKAEDKAAALYKHIYTYSFRSATELKSKGIHFRPSPSFCLNAFAFTSRFSYGELTVPQLGFMENTKCILLNMMAYELAPFTKANDQETCNYVYFMNTLINGAEDVMELRSKNIIHNFHGTDEEVAKAFNSMSKGAAYQALQGPIKVVSTQIQEHYNSRTKTWMAQLLNKYFDSPWSAIAFIAAILALVLTALQTFFGIYPHSSK